MLETCTSHNQYVLFLVQGVILCDQSVLAKVVAGEFPFIWSCTSNSTDWLCEAQVSNIIEYKICFIDFYTDSVMAFTLLQTAASAYFVDKLWSNKILLSIKVQYLTTFF